MGGALAGLLDAFWGPVGAFWAHLGCSWHVGGLDLPCRLAAPMGRALSAQLPRAVAANVRFAEAKAPINT
eukprot:8849141-Pyramimonas_sp.AAC.1